MLSEIESMQAAETNNDNDSFNSANNESWYQDFVAPVINKLANDESCRMVKLGPIFLSKTTNYGYKYFHLGNPLPQNAD